MRARNIKPGFFTNEVLSEVSFGGRLLFIGLWTICDREGRLEDRPKRIKMQLFPYDDCDVDDLLNQLVKFNFITRYVTNDCKYIQVNNFVKHQRPHPNEAQSEIPACTREMVISPREITRVVAPLIECGMLNDESNTSDTREITRVKPDEDSPKRKKFTKPTLEEVQAYCADRGAKIDPEAFIAHYDSNGWKVGRNPMKDWKASVRYWEKNNYGTKANRQPDQTRFTSASDNGHF